MTKDTFEMKIVEHRGRRLFFHQGSGRAVAEIDLAAIQRRTHLPVRREGRPVRAKFYKFEMQASALGLELGDKTVLKLTRRHFERVTHKSMDAAIDNYVVDEHGKRILQQMKVMFDSEEKLDAFVLKHRGKTYDEILELAKKRKRR